jgi:glycerol-3-phosphate dehydrogenase (NAD(P)+)
VVPSQRVRENVRLFAKRMGPSTVLLSASKGLETGACLRMTEVIAEELPLNDLAALSGPNISREIAQGLPASTVIAARDAGVARALRDIFMSPLFRVYAHTDVVGVELGGALKNVIALGAGILDGLKLGDNAKAAFMTRGLAEITRLGVAAGANPLTFAGLAGMGDLIVTCASPHSRNRHVGEELARGRTIDEIRASMTHVSEGVPTTAAAVLLARRFGVTMPISEQINRIVFEGTSPRVAIQDLMSRAATDEWAGLDAEGYLPSP